MDGVQHLIAGIDPAVAALLSKLVLRLGETNFPTPTARGVPPAGGQPRRESVLALLRSALMFYAVEMPLSCASLTTKDCSMLDAGDRAYT